MKRKLIIMWAMSIVLTLGCSIAAYGQQFTISNYTLVNEKRITRTVWEFVYKAQITNTGPNALNVTAALTSNSSRTTVVEGSLNFGSVASGSTVTSTDTFTIRHDRAYPFSTDALVWQISFEVEPCIALLGQPTLVSPTGSTTAAPTYVWNSVSGAEQYMLFVSDSGTAGKIQTWYTPAQAGCVSGGVCQITATTSLASGAATFNIRAWTSCGGGNYSPWSNPMAFTVEDPCVLGQPTLVSPTGSTTVAPTYVWNSVSGAEQYELYVSDSGTAGKIQAWYTPAQAGCVSGGVCQITPTTSLASGAATFNIRAWTSCGGGNYSPWSNPMAFTVNGSGGYGRYRGQASVIRYFFLPLFICPDPHNFPSRKKAESWTGGLTSQASSGCFTTSDKHLQDF